MKFILREKILLIIILFFLFYVYFIFKIVNHFTSKTYIIEYFTGVPIPEHTNTSHTVDLPLTNATSCSNFCGPTARCAITGQQCFTDVDCPGCKPQTPSNSLSYLKKEVPGANDAGKLTVGVTPTYSPLTTGYGTFEKVITDNMYAQPSQPNFGVNNWKNTFNKGQQLYNQRYKPTQSNNMPNYQSVYSITGEFVDDGPLPANY